MKYVEEIIKAEFNYKAEKTYASKSIVINHKLQFHEY